MYEVVNNFMHDRKVSAPLMELLCDMAHAREKLGKHVTFLDGMNDENQRGVVFLYLAIKSEARHLV